MRLALPAFFAFSLVSSVARAQTPGAQAAGMTAATDGTRHAASAREPAIATQRRPQFRPERRGGIAELAFDVRVGSSHARENDTHSPALVLTSSATYRGHRPYYVRARLAPTGGVFGGFRVSSGSFSTGYDARNFSFGAGVGGARLLEVPEDRCNGIEPCALALRRRAPAVVFEARFGARDGFHIDVQSAYVVDEEDVRYGALRIAALVPALRRLSVSISSDFANPDLGYFEAGLGFRVQAIGDGGRRTLFLTLGWSLIGFEVGDDGDGLFDLAQTARLGLEWRP